MPYLPQPGALRGAVDRSASALLIVGLAALTLHNWRIWRRERAVAPPTPAPPPNPAAWPAQPLVSVLVAAWDEAATIEGHLRSFEALSYPHRELLLCAGGRDDTLELARRLGGPWVRVIEQAPGEGKQRALRRCLAASRGAIIVLTDADCLFDDEAFIRLIAPIASGQAEVTTGVSEPLPCQHPLPLVQYQWFNDALWARHLPEQVDGVLGRNCALRREVLEGLGALDDPVRTGTDYYLSRRLTEAGYAIRAVPDSRVPTEYPATPLDYLRMWRRWNKNLLIHGLRFGAWRDVRGVLTAAGLYAAALGLLALAPLLGPAALSFGSLLYVAAGASRLRRIAAGSRLAGRPLGWRCVAGVPLYTALDMFAALLAVWDAATPGGRGRW